MFYIGSCVKYYKERFCFLDEKELDNLLLDIIADQDSLKNLILRMYYVCTREKNKILLLYNNYDEEEIIDKAIKIFHESIGFYYDEIIKYKLNNGSYRQGLANRIEFENGSFVNICKYKTPSTNSSQYSSGFFSVNRNIDNALRGQSYDYIIEPTDLAYINGFLHIRYAKKENVIMYDH